MIIFIYLFSTNWIYLAEHQCMIRCVKKDQQ